MENIGQIYRSGNLLSRLATVSMMMMMCVSNRIFLMRKLANRIYLIIKFIVCFSSIWKVLFVGVRTLTEGEAIVEYVGNNGYRYVK